MEIKTKFGVGDEVYCLFPFGEIRKKRIHRISITVIPDSVAIGYFMSRQGGPLPFAENEVFASRQEAMEYNKLKNYNNGKSTG